MDLLLSAVDILMRWDVALALLVGSIGGVLIGAIPGVGPAVAIAILLPATFSMDPIVGLTVLLGIYGSSMYGGAIPAVLINTPGTAVNALSTYDGYPMTARGEPQRALSLAYSASFYGGIFSVACLILFAPVLARVAPMFGSREIFLAALLGTVLVVTAHRGQSLIAAALCAFGIFIQTIGFEPVKYTQRYTFGQDFLQGGMNLIVVVLGLFALSQAFVLLTSEDVKFKTTRLKGGLFQGMRELARHPRVATVSAFFGVLMGIIPGVGEFNSQFLSYTYAQRTSKRPEDFGHGSSEGLIASETSNNAVPAAAMVPLLALGIPGEQLTAMMLSVFYVHNVVPGPGLFQNSMDFVVALYISLGVLNVLVMLFLLVATRPLIQVVKIPNRFLGICVLTLSFVGVYSLRNSVSDCVLAAVFGVFGYILKRLDLPSVPIILGMVLGNIMEVKLRAGMARVKEPLDFIDRPISFILFVAIVLIILAHVRRVILERREVKEAEWQTKNKIDALRRLDVAPQGLFVAGTWKDGSGAPLDVTSPIDGSRLTTLAGASAADVERAVAAARAAFERGTWSRAAPSLRKKVLRAIADRIEAEALELAVLGVRDNGTELAMALKAEPGSAAGTFRYYAEALDKLPGEIAPTAPDVLGLVHRVPVGVVGAIVPWNFPLMIGARKLAPALAAGNSVVLKPAETASLTLLRLAQICADCGLPEGVLNVVTGTGAETGNALALSMGVDVLAFTGSGATGRRLLEASARSNLKRVYLELGGKSPNIVFADAPDLRQAAKVSAAGIFRNSGQVCVAGSRLLVEASVHDDFVALLKTEAEALKVGDPLAAGTQIGAVNSEAQLARVLSFMDGSGELVTGGARILKETGGSYMAPTIVAGVGAGDRLFREEVFGPVLAVTPFETEAEALRLANATDYGLAAAVWTGNLGRAHRMVAGIRAGVVHVNTYGGADMTVPLGGVGQSGNGHDKSLHAMDKYQDLKTAWIQL